MRTDAERLEDSTAPLITGNGSLNAGMAYGSETALSSTVDMPQQHDNIPVETTTSILSMLLQTLKQQKFLTTLLIAASGGILFFLYDLVFLFMQRAYPKLGGDDCSNVFGFYTPCKSAVQCTYLISQDSTFSWKGYDQPTLYAICKGLSCLSPIAWGCGFDSWTKLSGYSLKYSYENVDSNVRQWLGELVAMLALFSFSACLIEKIVKNAKRYHTQQHAQQAKGQSNEDRLKALVEKGYDERRVPEAFLCPVLFGIMNEATWWEGAVRECYPGTMAIPAHHLQHGLKPDGTPIPRIDRKVFTEIMATGNKKHPLTQKFLENYGRLMLDRRLQNEIKAFLATEEAAMERQPVVREQNEEEASSRAEIIYFDASRP